VKGRLSIREDEAPKIICGDVFLPSLQKENNITEKKSHKKLYLRIDNKICEQDLTALCALLKYFCGDIPVYLHNSDEKTTKLLDKENWIGINDELLNELYLRLGEENVKVV
jgi:DNA polymerase-3 subunit alpha